ncbi:MAG: hypothetical protein E3J70_10070 [Candidatus Heimdallarchaeota archaeon]|nr:MAG: hypothetical protein E3J70_10070 [Candidatus Heimdallarchaeota archaeon]
MSKQENQIGLKEMSSDETKKTGNTDTPLQPIIEEKKTDEEIDLKINMNRWGIAFFIMFIAVLGYLVIGAFVFLPPFEYNIIDQELLVYNPRLLAALLVIALVFLGLGFYFGWVKKSKETDEEEFDDEFQNGHSEQEEVIFSGTLDDKDNDSS